MAQMAAELGLSRVAVSAVVNGRAKQARLADSTAQRVREHLDRRGYVPSSHAIRLRTAPARVIGIMHIDVIYSHLIEAFHKLAENLGRSDTGLEIIVTPRERLEAAVREILARRVTDLVWVHNNSAGEEYRDGTIGKYLSNLRTVIYNFPFDSARGDRELLDRGFALVGVDRTKHTRQLARFLQKLGHTRIAIPDVDARSAAHPLLRDAFADAGITVADCPSPFLAAEFRNAMRHQGITAAWFHGDGPACRAIESLRSIGVRIPEDLTVIGFDGMSRAFSHDLTTLAMPVQDMVTKVCEIIAGSEHKLRHCLDIELVQGRTHAPPPESEIDRRKRAARPWGGGTASK